MSQFYEVEYTLYGSKFKTILLADCKDQLQQRLGVGAIIESYKVLQ